MYKQIDSNKRKTFLFIFIFLIFIIGLGWILSYVFQAYWILLLAVAIAIFQAFSSYYWSDKIVLFNLDNTTLLNLSKSTNQKD